jgi:arabinofuranan 3-O-arabinosyltransferase
LAGDPLGPKFSRPVWIDADTQQRRNSQYSLYQNQSNLLASGEPSPMTGDPSLPSGGPPNQWIVVPGDSHQTTVQLDGAEHITASSFGPVFYQAPGQQPLEAFLADAGRGGAAWEASPTDPRPWIEIRFDHSVTLSKIKLTPLAGIFWTPITKVQITTARGQVTQPLARVARPQELRTPAGASRWLRITLVGLRRPSGNAGAPGLAHIAIPGVSVSQRWVVPDDGPTTPGIVPTYLFSSPQPNQFAVFKVAEDEAHLSRQFTVPRTAVFAVAGQATPLESPLLAASQLSLGTSHPTPADPAATYSVPCGSGPPIIIDGHSYATSVRGTFGELDALQPMPLSVCGFGGAVRLGAGTHTVTAYPDAAFKVTSLQLAGTPPAVSPARGVAVTQWGNDDRALTVAAGPAAIINVHENYNPGWVATVGGRQLRGVRLDGWQQGWILPAADTSEQVTLKFAPDNSFRASLVVGAAIALALLAWIALTIRRRRNFDAVRSAVSRQDASTASERTRVGTASGSRARRNLYFIVWTGAITLVVFALAGPVAVVVPACVALGLLARRRRAALAWIAGGAEVLAGIAIAVHPGYRIGVLLGSGSYTAQALGALALAALAVSLLPAFDQAAQD